MQKISFSKKITEMRVDRSVKIVQAGGPSCRDFWKELRSKKKTDEFSSLKIPNSNEITTDQKVIKKFCHELLEYSWKNE